MIASRTMLLVPVLLLAVFSRTSHAQGMELPTGTFAQNVTSDSTQLTYTSLWRSDTEDGFYQAYSNLSDASVTFTFTGVGATFWSVRKADRGLCQLIVDGSVAYTYVRADPSDIFEADGLRHTITLAQVGPDARFGYYPYLITEIWTEFVPINIASYTATESVPTAHPTGGSHGQEVSDASRVAPIIGGVVGGVVALILISFLLYLWRRDKKTRERGRTEGAPVYKVRKAGETMAIEDETSPYAHSPYSPGPYGPHGPGGGYIASATGTQYGGSNTHVHPHNLALMTHHGATPSPVHWAGNQHLIAPAHLPDLTDSSGSYSSAYPVTDATRYPYGQRSISTPSNASVYGAHHYPHYAASSREPMTRSPRDYPYVTQSVADDTRRLPVPEI
ncbi:BZ3500_MvSof-1268-A1-R1_Chr1-3g01923 [Microbotryum saponariae]|uniref:BZ3500_MvSof-1268-A1-R1_Chr1-3g01923 protein n=1 Tax=Microbotryum saponariae TaxID=289078 RepID=A0A2X0KMI0_9BASI|nr:BZ3500_MvSof-1268-A1-R1_Chr1-3g01923 [Microbotryum saponariae]SCZ94909.1 BZ3501_MvSof-1269-A2-R1_Chr1-3g01525 [Microbotryum saponariae]